tara:strand:- start:438 stop:578 length:141 start_codon:yes stop_codon:yes gene_type:complete
VDAYFKLAIAAESCKLTQLQGADFIFKNLFYEIIFGKIKKILFVRP